MIETLSLRMKKAPLRGLLFFGTPLYHEPMPHVPISLTSGRVFLVGPMGAGKSTVGRCLADALGYEFLDSDKVIEERTGADIPWIFDVEGEAGFRKRESDVIDELTQCGSLVLATGGGAVTGELNRKHLRDRGLVVYLQTSVDTQIERTRFDRNRPLLQIDDPAAKLRELLAQRDPWYREIADIVVNTDGKNPAAVADDILLQLKGHEHANAHG